MSSESKSRSAGWWIERRAVIAAPFAAAAAVIIARSAAAQSTPAASAAAALNGRMLDFAEFVAACEALAADLLRDEKRNHDLYLHRIAALCSRVALSQVPRGKLFAAAGLDPAVELGPIHRAPPVILIQWRLAPHAVLPPHNHQPVDVLSLCLEGECRVRHYEIQGAAPAPGASGEFEVRETLSALLTPGRSTSVSPVRDNIHTFEAAAEGALGVDVNTILPGEGDWSYMRLSASSKLSGGDRYAAHWIGQDPSH